MSDFARLWDTIEDDLGFNDCNMNRGRPHTGMPGKITEYRDEVEIKGVTMRDLRDAFVRAVCQCGGVRALSDEAGKGEGAALCENDVYKCDDLDLMAVSQTLGCEIEKLMGIYPNVLGLKEGGETDGRQEDS